MNIGKAVATVCLSAFAFAAAPAAGDLDAGKSRVTATFKQMNVPVEGRFTKIGGSVLFDAAKPAAASARLTIDTGSFDLGMEDYNAEVRKKEWFDSKTYPQATFVSSAFKPLGGNRYQADGQLQLKGKNQTLSLPVTVLHEGAATLFDGSFKLSRQFFAIGDAEWNEVVDDSVTIQFHIVQAP